MKHATALKKAKGTLNKAKPDHIADEPLPKIVDFCPPPPDQLGDAESLVWNEVVPKIVSLGIFTQLDMKLLIMYCTEVAMFDRATNEIRKEGAVGIYGKNGYPMKNPWIDVRNKCVSNIVVLSKEFGLSPSARTKISVSKSKPQGMRASILSKTAK